MANAGTHRLSMANTSDNNTKRRKNNAQNEIKYIHYDVTCKELRSYEVSVQQLWGSAV